MFTPNFHFCSKSHDKITDLSLVQLSVLDELGNQMKQELTFVARFNALSPISVNSKFIAFENDYLFYIFGRQANHFDSD